MREHHRRNPRVVVGVGGVLGAIVLTIAIASLWPTPPEPVAHQSGGVVTRVPSSPQHAQLAQALRAARQRIGLSLDEAGERAGMQPAEISNLESGIIIPTSTDIATLSRVYQLSRDEWTNLVILASNLR